MVKTIRKRKRARHDAGTDAWNRIIRPFCVFAAKDGNYGFMSAVARRIKDLSSMDVKPQQVRQWLMLKDDERIEPRAGMAAILVEAVNAAKAEYEAKAATRAGLALKA